MFETIKSWFTPNSSKARQANDTLKANAEKALKMKQEAGPQTRIPEHATSHSGGVAGGQVSPTDAALNQEGAGTPNLSRAHGARVGDTGKTTGPGR
jgi:hypothetical protein